MGLFPHLALPGFHARLRALAERRNGEFFPVVRTLLTHQRAKIDLPVGDALVRVEIVSSGERQLLQASAGYVMGAGPTFAVRRHGLLHSIGKTLGSQDLKHGHDAEFDKVFNTRTEDTTATREAWTAPARRKMLESHSRSNVSATPLRVDLAYVFDAARNTSKLDAAVDIVGQLASYGGSWLAPLHRLPGAEYIPPTGAFEARELPRIRVPVRGTSVDFHPTLDRQQFTSTASARLERKMAAFHETFERDRPSGELDSDVFPEGAKEHLHDAAPGHLEIGGEFVRYTLHGAGDPPRLMAAANLVVAIARGSRSQGAFR